MTNTTKGGATVSGSIQQVFADASGAPGLYSCGDYTWGFDFLAGEIRSHGVRIPQGHHAGFKRAHALCEWAYRRDLEKLTTAEWRARNVALYAEEVR